LTPSVIMHSLAAGVGIEFLYNTIRDLLAATACSAFGSHHVQKETGGEFCDGQHLLGDIQITNWFPSKDLLLGSLPTRKYPLEQGAKSPGIAAQNAYDRKMKKWAEIRENSPHDFQPLSFELFGGCHPESVVTINRMGRLAAVATASDVATTRERLWQRLSVEVYKGAANAIEPQTSAILLDDDFGGAPRFDFNTPERPAPLASTGPLASFSPKSKGRAPFLVSSNWFTDSTLKSQPLPNSSPFFV